jgi:hypothetical protein
MHKYQTYARSRTPVRGERQSPARRDSSGIAAARQVATRFVAARWPALAGVEPEVTLQHEDRRPTPALIARLGLAEAELGHCPPAATYTFTFTSQYPTADGATAPLVAAVTVDAQRRIVKTSLSK